MTKLYVWILRAKCGNALPNEFTKFKHSHRAKWVLLKVHLISQKNIVVSKLSLKTLKIPIYNIAIALRWKSDTFQLSLFKIPSLTHYHDIEALTRTFYYRKLLYIDPGYSAYNNNSTSKKSGSGELKTYSTQKAACDKIHLTLKYLYNRVSRHSCYKFNSLTVGKLLTGRHKQVKHRKKLIWKNSPTNVRQIFYQQH